MKGVSVQRIGDIPAEPWKNGGGLTRTLARGKNAWRVSLASIDQDGQYSRFPDTTRLSVILRGAGVILRRPGAVVELPPLIPGVYDGDAVWDACLIEGPCVALNVMARTDAHRVSAVPIDRLIEVPPDTAGVVLADHASLRLHDSEGATLDLHPGQFAVLAPCASARGIAFADPCYAGPPSFLVWVSSLDKTFPALTDHTP